MMNFKPVQKGQDDSNVIIVYTDGGCRSHAQKGGTILPTDKAAWASFMKLGGYERLIGRAGHGRTNNQMEMKAVIEALKAIKNPNLPVKVHCDSALVINCINQNWYKKWERDGWTKKGGLKNAELWQELIEQYRRFKFIEFVKVKGHADDKYNILVDKYLNELMDELPQITEEELRNG